MFRNPFNIHAKDKKNKLNLLTQSENNLPNHEFIVNLTELGNGNSAKVLNLKGSRVMIGRLEALGILPGTIIIKKSTISSKGPIVVKKGATQFALGYDMAKNILVEPIGQEV